MLNVAIVGTGFIGSSHVAAYKGIHSAKLVAIIEANQSTGQKAAQEANCRYYPTFEDAAAAESIDLLDICVPTFLHEEFAVKAAKAGMNVLCEKPVTLTIESFDRMTRAAEENGVRFMVAQAARWWPEFVEAANFIKADKLGKLHMIYEKRLAQHPTWSNWHRAPEKSGGGLYDLNIHDIDYLYSLFGMPKSVYAIGWKSETGCWNHLSSSLVWEDGTKAICETSLEMTGDYPFSIEFRATGDEGTLGYSFTAGFNIKDGEAAASLIHYPVGGVPASVPVTQADPIQEEICAYINAILSDLPTPVPPEESRQVLQIVLGIKQSLEQGILITF